MTRGEYGIDRHRDLALSLRRPFGSGVGKEEQGMCQGQGIEIQDYYIQIGRLCPAHLTARQDAPIIVRWAACSPPPRPSIYETTNATTAPAANIINGWISLAAKITALPAVIL